MKCLLLSAGLWKLKFDEDLLYSFRRNSMKLHPLSFAYTLFNLKQKKMQMNALYACKKDTVDSRYLDFGYLEQPLVSKKNLVLV